MLQQSTDQRETWRELLEEADRCRSEYDYLELDVFHELRDYCSRPDADVNPYFVNTLHYELRLTSVTYFSHGLSLMHLGCSHPALLKLMLALGGDVKVECSEGHPFAFCVLGRGKRNVESLRILLDKGANTTNVWTRAISAPFCHKRDLFLVLIQCGLMPVCLFASLPSKIRSLLETQIVMVALCTPLFVVRFHKLTWLTLDCLRLLYTYL